MFFKVVSCIDNSLAFNNYVYFSPDDCKKFLKTQYVKINDYIWCCASHERVDSGTIMLNNIQRMCASLALNDQVEVIKCTEKYNNIEKLNVNVLLRKTGVPNTITLETEILRELIKVKLNKHVLITGQRFQLDYDEKIFVFTVLNEVAGIISEDSDIEIITSLSDKLILRSEFKPEFNLEKMEIGGLDKQFQEIFRRAFASRCIPPQIMEELGIKHVKGILLYGPPGTGKTLIARQIAKMLNTQNVKVVKGPEILSKFVGESEENIRKLFIDAEREYINKGRDSKLHIIILDEIDAICKQRGSVSSGSGVHDTIVNQLLSKIDGVDALDNILLIGMTNRKELLDDALIRPGRLEIHIEVGLPDENGRLQIFTIHTNKIKNSKHLDANVDLAELAALTKNFTGSEIEGVVKAACSYSFNEQLDMNNLQNKIDSQNILITRHNFLRAIEEVPAKFGVSEKEFSFYLQEGIIEYSKSFSNVVKNALILLTK